MADDDELMDVEPHDEAADSIVLLVRIFAEGGHLTEDRDGTLPRLDDLGEGLECGRHRIGTRVVGIVDHDDAVPARQHLHSPALRPRHGLEGGDGFVERRRQLIRDRERGERVHHVVFSENPQADRPVHVADRQRERGPGCGGSQIIRTNIRLGIEPEPDGARDRHPRHRRDALIIDVENRDGITGEPGHYLGLRALSGLDAPEFTRVSEPDLEHHGDVRCRYGHDARDVTDSARAHLDDQEPRVALDGEHRQRSADLVVERAGGRDGRSLGRENRPQHVLGGRLAIGSRDSDNPKHTRGTNRGNDASGESRESREGVLDDDLGNR